MRILQLCNKNPYPPLDGGAIAMHSLARTYANNNHNVTVLAMNTGKHTNQSLVPEKPHTRIRTIGIPVNTSINPACLLYNFLFSRKPYIATRFVNKHFTNKLIELISKELFDIIQLEGLYLTSYIPVIRKHSTSKIIYRAHNIESDIWVDLARSGNNFLKKYYLNNMALRLQLYEKSIVNTYDFLLPISPNDNAILSRWGNSKPSHVTYTGILPEDFNAGTDKRTIKKLFFIGALDWLPNQEGLIWFLEKIWVKLIKQFQHLEFHVAGRNAPNWIKHKCISLQATFHGEVPSAKQFIDAYDIMVVPLFSGSGLRIKIIEGMARSKPIITTEKGIAGMPSFKENTIIISDHTDAIIKKIEQLTSDTNLYNTYCRNAHSYALRHFSELNIHDGLMKFLNSNKLC